MSYSNDLYIIFRKCRSIYFQIYRVDCISILVPLFSLEDVDDGPRDDPDVVWVFLHRKRLPRTRLSVGHDRRVVAF